MSSSRWLPELSDAQLTSISGSVSGFIATFAKQPLQRIKWIRQVDAGVPVPYVEVLRKTVQVDGPLGLFRGSVAGVMRNVPHSTLVYTAYPHFEGFVLKRQQTWQEALPHEEQSSLSLQKPAFSTRFWAGYATLFTAPLVTHPLDTLRVRISVMHGEQSSTAAVIKSVIDTGGIRALYQGFGATLIGAGPRGALGFGVFETLKDLSERCESIGRACVPLVTGTYSRVHALHPTTCRHGIMAQSTTARKLVFGYVAGIVAETAIYPLDTVRR